MKKTKTSFLAAALGIAVSSGVAALTGAAPASAATPGSIGVCNFNPTPPGYGVLEYRAADGCGRVDISGGNYKIIAPLHDDIRICALEGVPAGYVAYRTHVADRCGPVTTAGGNQFFLRKL